MKWVEKSLRLSFSCPAGKLPEISACLQAQEITCPGHVLLRPVQVSSKMLTRKSFIILANIPQRLSTHSSRTMQGVQLVDMRAISEYCSSTYLVCYCRFYPLWTWSWFWTTQQTIHPDCGLTQSVHLIYWTHCCGSSTVRLQTTSGAIKCSASWTEFSGTNCKVGGGGGGGRIIGKGDSSHLSGETSWYIICHRWPSWSQFFIKSPQIEKI